MRRRTNRSKKRKQKNIIIVTSLSLILFLTIGYAVFSTNISLKVKGNIKDKSRVIQAWSSTDQTDFHSDYYKENIVSATFLDNANVPSNAAESWNVSEDKRHGGVMAWAVPNNEDSTKYDLYIGAKNGVIANENSSFLFYDFQNIKSINFNNYFITDNVKNMRGMFMYCSSVSVLDLSSFNTINVTDMANMFNMFLSDTAAILENQLEKIILGDDFKVDNVTIMAQMFVGCDKLKDIDVSKWNTSNVTHMGSVFALCKSLQRLDLSNWNTSKVTKMNNMFQSCTSLTELDLSSFDTSNVMDMSVMFQGVKLGKIDLCSFNTKNVTTMFGMFAYTSNLKKISVGPNWSTSQANTTGMFTNSGVSSVTTAQC